MVVAVETMVAQKELSARSQLRAWVVAEVDGQSEVKAPELARAALKHFARDRTFLNRLAKEMLREMIHEMVIETFSRTRGRSNIVAIGDGVTTRDGIKQRGLKLRQKWNLWREHAGDRHILLKEMLRDDLILAARERRARGDVEYGLAEIWERMAETLPDGVKVGDHFTDEEIDRISSDVEQHGEVG